MVPERRIGVDARPLCHPGTGIYRYTRELLTRMCQHGGEWFLYSHQGYDTSGLDLPNVHHRAVGLPHSLRAGQLAHLFFPHWVRRDQVEVFWGPRHQLPLMLPPNIRAAVTIHDLVFRDNSETMRFPGREIENFFTPRALARADTIAVVSQFTRQRLQHYFAQYTHKVAVVPGASMLVDAGVAGENSMSAGQGDYFLFVGTLEPRKNLPRLLRAFQRYCNDIPEPLPLKIVGGSGWGGEDIAGLVNDLQLTQRVELLGKIDDHSLRRLYSAAYALLMPSLYEGFGLPVVEALSLGVPVITSRESAMEEVAGSAGLYVDPESELEIGDALLRLSEDRQLYDSLRSRTAVEIGRYDWDDSATAMSGLLMS
jgi:glycosyltransferase involved in cell wall biosynthesis